MTLFGTVLALMLAIFVLVKVDPASLARFLRALVPLGLMLGGVLMAWVGRAGIGMPMIGFGVVLWTRNRRIRSARMQAASAQSSNVRTAAFEMQLDHETGDMDGTILFGDHTGETLNQLHMDNITAMFTQLENDLESQALLETYLDRRSPGWREDTDRHASSGETASASTGPMSHEEAHQVLGLQPGASIDQIRDSHRRLMKSFHPDSGGTTFLAAKINEAKDILLRGH